MQFRHNEILSKLYRTEHSVSNRIDQMKSVIENRSDSWRNTRDGKKYINRIKELIKCEAALTQAVSAIQEYIDS